MVYNCAVTIYPAGSRNAYGEKDWSSGSDYKARVVEKTTEVLDARGEKTNADLLVHLPLDTSVSIGQKIEYNSNEYIVLKVSKPKNEVGHTRDVKLICKRYGEG
jgi:hypothetical protein